MKILKNILLVLIGIVALVLVIAFFLPKEMHTEKNIIIERNIEETFDYIRYLRNQDNYSVWSRKDPFMQKQYQGQDGQVGFVSAWDSQDEQVGQGEQTITAISINRRIDFNLRFIRPFESESAAYMETTVFSPNKTQVSWGFNGKIPYPQNIFLLFMDMDEMIGKDFEEGLTQLKIILEVKNKYFEEEKEQIEENKEDI